MMRSRAVMSVSLIEAVMGNGKLKLGRDMD